MTSAATARVAAPRTRLSAAARHRQIVGAARPLFAERGYFGTPTVEVAAAAGVSHGYMFRLIGTKEKLFVAVIDDCFAEIMSILRAAAAEIDASGPDDRLHEIGLAYAEVLARRELLQIQLQATAASSVPSIRAHVQSGFATLVEFLREQTGADEAALQQSMARGMLCNFIVAMGAERVRAPWARTLTGELTFPRTSV